MWQLAIPHMAINVGANPDRLESHVSHLTRETELYDDRDT
jgi:hypothetical protein